MTTPAGLGRRNQLVPQMEEYDRIAVQWRPFLMYFHGPNYRSPVMNTDALGFRYTHDRSASRMDAVDSEVSLLVGGSTVFGVGATNDSKTMPSVLNRITSETWVNYGACAYTSTQESLLFLMHHQRHKKVKRIVLFSGANDLTIFFRSKYYDSGVGAFFSGSRFYDAMSRGSSLSGLLVRPFFESLVKKMHGEQDLSTLTIRQMVAVIMRKASMAELEGVLRAVPEKISNHEQEKEKVIQVLAKNIRNWKMLAAHHQAELTYILQPLDIWLDRRQRSPLETQIFDMLDAVQGEHWKIFLNSVQDKYAWFSERIKQVCDDAGVAFHDANRHFNSEKFNGQHIFVDRIHLNDAGYEIASEYIKGLL